MEEPGSFYVGKRSFAAEDASRENRKVSFTVWYPAVPPADLKNRNPVKDVKPDTSGKPYPLILSSTKVANIFAPYLVSHGFTWVSVDYIDSYFQMEEQMYSQPLDILFAFNQVADNPPADLKDLIDVNHTGVIGYSFDGYNALVLSGARVNPGHYLAQCPEPDTATKAILGNLSAFYCGPAKNWGAFASRAGDAITISDDGLWQPITDERIRAVMPLAGEGWWLFGEKGLAAVEKPILIIVSTNDELYEENALIFEHLGTPKKALISFVGKDHMMILDSKMVGRMAHFAVAFFGYHLQGRSDLASYFSEQFVNQYSDLAWGVYKK